MSKLDKLLRELCPEGVEYKIRRDRKILRRTNRKIKERF